MQEAKKDRLCLLYFFLNKNIFSLSFSCEVLYGNLCHAFSSSLLKVGVLSITWCSLGSDEDSSVLRKQAAPSDGNASIVKGDGQ